MYIKVIGTETQITQEYIQNLYRKNFEDKRHITLKDYLRSKNMTFEHYKQSKRHPRRGR